MSVMRYKCDVGQGTSHASASQHVMKQQGERQQQRWQRQRQRQRNKGDICQDRIERRRTTISHDESWIGDDMRSLQQSRTMYDAYRRCYKGSLREGRRNSLLFLSTIAISSYIDNVTSSARAEEINSISDVSTVTIKEIETLPVQEDITETASSSGSSSGTTPSIEEGQASVAMSDTPMPSESDSLSMTEDAVSKRNEELNRRIAVLNNAPEAFPTFVRTQYDVRHSIYFSPLLLLPLLHVISL